MVNIMRMTLSRLSHPEQTGTVLFLSALKNWNTTREKLLFLFDAHLSDDPFHPFRNPKQEAGDGWD